jgi:parallel beta-helix repeat protein
MFFYHLDVNESYATTLPSNLTDQNTNNISATSDDNGEYNETTKRVALIENKFTHAAYQNGSFYNFYAKYSPQLYGNSSSYLDDKWRNFTVSTDLSLLKDRPVPDGPFPYYRYPEYLTVPYKFLYDFVFQNVKKYTSDVTNLTDVDVHEGEIFHPGGENAYDVLFLFHNEYVTQTEYDNLNRFVTNGGAIVFTQANALFAEVSYNKTTNSISLVKGHSWEFDGNTARGSLSERWVDDNKEWIGSNFLDIPSSYHIYFRNNPFDMIHTEEQYVSNPNANILIDYGAFNLTRQYHDAVVAAYEMDYQKGKIIHLGIWAHTVYKNPVFIEYFDNVILPLALNITTKDTPLFNTFLLEQSRTDSSNTECTNYEPQTNTITVLCETNLSQISGALNNGNILREEADGVWILNASIIVNPDATINIDRDDTSWLKITNKNGTEANHITILGNALLDNVKITSWNPDLNDVVKQNLNGTIPRPYILFDSPEKSSNISDSEFAFLGYNSYPSNGIVYYNGPSGGKIVNSTFHNMWDGFFSNFGQFITIKDNKFYDNLRYGINPHSESHDINITGNTVYNNTRSGIIASDSNYDIIIDKNTVHDNGMTGITLSLDTNNSTIRNNFVHHEKLAILVDSSSNNTISNNLLQSNNQGLIIGEVSSQNQVYNNTIINSNMGISS